MTTASQLLHKPLTSNYSPQFVGNIYYQSMMKMPPFMLRYVYMMLMDPHITFGLWLIKGPIRTRTRISIKTTDEDLRQYLADNLNRFWENSVSRALKAIEWGYSCSEVLYSVKNGRLHFETLKDIHSLDATAFTENGEFVGAGIANVPGNPDCFLAPPKVLWHVHNREHHPIYGRSRLYGAFRPWLETWSDGGFRDCRRLFFMKYAYDGGIMRYPIGESPTSTYSNGDVLLKSNRDLAREILDKKKSGGSIVLPNDTNEQGQFLWTYDPPSTQPAPAGIMEYGRELRNEIWEGIGIPPEIGQAEGTGAYAGRKVPQEGFLASLQELSNWAVFDFDTQVLRRIAYLTFGDRGLNYELQTYGLVNAADAMNEEAFTPTTADRDPNTILASDQQTEA